MLARLTALVALSQALACGGRHPPLPADQVATLEPDGSLMVEVVDGAAMRRGYPIKPLVLAPGAHTIRVRRRVEGPSDPATRPPHPIRIGTDGLGTAAYVSDSYCALTFTAVAGQRYRAATVAPEGESGPWTASLVGPQVDMSCSGRDPVPTALLGRTLYLCCNMMFHKRVATDANYAYTGSDSSLLRAGTAVVVTDVRRDRIGFRPEPGGKIHRVYLEHGNLITDPEAYFSELLRDGDATAGAPRSASDDADVMRLVPGMTRDEAIRVRGYPPLHRTPDRQAAEWLYYRSPGRGTYVEFADGVIKSVRDAPAP